MLNYDDSYDDNDPVNGTGTPEGEPNTMRMEDDQGEEGEYEPSEQEVLEYCEWLGMDVVHDRCLMWISREALKAPLPENWKVCTTEDREAYYFNVRTGESIWDHPMDAYYKALYKQEKAVLDKKRKKMRMYSGSLPITPLVDFFSEKIIEDGMQDPAVMAKDKPWTQLPDALCDPIDYKLYHEPVVLPTSGRTVSRHTIINNRWRDPFSREYIENRRLVPNVDKRREVDAFLDTSLTHYFMLLTPNAQGLARLIRVLPYLVDKDEEMCVKGQNMLHNWLIKHTQNLPSTQLPHPAPNSVQRTQLVTPRKAAPKKTVAAGGALTAIREGSGRKPSMTQTAVMPHTFIHDIMAMSEEDMNIMLNALLTMSTASSISILLCLVTKIPALGAHAAFSSFSAEILNVLHLSPTDLNGIRAHCTVRPPPENGPHPGAGPTVTCNNHDDILSLQWVVLLAELTPPVLLLSEVDWNAGLILLTAIVHNAAPNMPVRPGTLCSIARNLKGWPEKLCTVEEHCLEMLLEFAFQCGAETMVLMLHDVCIHGGERLMEPVRIRRAQILSALLEVHTSDTAASSSTLQIALSHLGALLVFHEVCKLEDFAMAPALALLIGQNLFPRLTRMQWRPKHFEVTVSRLITMCAANPVLSSTVVKTSAVDFLLKELGKKKRSHDEVRIRVDAVEADMRRLEQSNAINNWLLLTTGAKIKLYEQQQHQATPIPVQKKGEKEKKERILPNLSTRATQREVLAPPPPEDSDNDEDIGERLRHLMEKGLQKRIDIAAERAQHTTSILNMLLQMRLKVTKQPRGGVEPSAPSSIAKPPTQRSNVPVPRKESADVQGVALPPCAEKESTGGLCSLPRL